MSAIKVRPIRHFLKETEFYQARKHRSLQNSFANNKQGFCFCSRKK